MFNAIKQFFDTHVGNQALEDPQHRLRLATAALLLEMTRVDNEVKAEEREAVERGIAKAFDLSAAETSKLVTLAEEEAQNATCYHEFTRLINEGFSREQKVMLVEQLWEVAFADAELEKYEEHLVRKLSDLLYVPHSEFIRAKHRVMERLNLS
jgi:uncharacterized tellurite resistance protein B-like protein